jgi:hypothetical protein
MTNSFREAKEALATAEREWTSVGSLNAAAAQAPLVACEAAVEGLWRAARGTSFPYQIYSRHKPGEWITRLGIQQCYSSDTQTFLKRLDSYALDKVRYEATSSFQQHTSASALERGKELITGTRRFIEETEMLSSDPSVLNTLRRHS